MTRRHIHAVTLVVPDYDSAIAFYTGVLGFDLLSDEPQEEGKRWVMVAQPGAETALLLACAATETQRQAIGNQTGGRVGFFLHTDDFDADYEALRAKGLQFEEAPRREPYGSVAVFRDPFGNRWDLLQLSTDEA
ncbi:VOC family protein [Aestuariibius sp. 2305UL40-4]|uniref:VOC family protein n=1 Tax=Aestuariibius violaceus TaxID=3234132 RepID=UPI00345EAF15